VVRCGLKLSQMIAIRTVAGKASAGNGRTPEPGPVLAWRDVPDRPGPRPLRDAFQLTTSKGGEAKAGKKGQRT
jgi:hypothetical protein